MKKILSLLIGVFVTLTLLAQPPRPGYRPLPNQFRDFVDHQQRFGMERPTIEKKDGKVIITMSEEQYKKMQFMRQKSHMILTRMENANCRKCDFIHKRHDRPRFGHRPKI